MPPNQHVRFNTRTLVFLLALALFSSNSLAFKMPKLSQLEWQSMPEICKGTRHTGGRELGFEVLPLSPAEKGYVGRYGLWHFCAGYVYLQRMEQGRATALDRKKALGEMNYVAIQLQHNPEHPLTPLINTSRARYHRLVGDHERALELLAIAKKHHPTTPKIYTTEAGVLFDQGDYEQAAKVLAEGNAATGDSVPELHYFLGLAYFKAGNIEQARVYEKKAREGRYPFRFLTRKLREHDAKNARGAE